MAYPKRKLGSYKHKETLALETVRATSAWYRALYEAWHDLDVESKWKVTLMKIPVSCKYN